MGYPKFYDHIHELYKCSDITIRVLADKAKEIEVLRKYLKFPMQENYCKWNCCKLVTDKL